MVDIEWQPQGEWTDIRFETTEGIAKITIDRPEVRNAFRPLTTRELIAAFEVARDDPTIGVNHFGINFDVLPGDVNGDRVVNSQDLVLARNAILGTGDPIMIGWADIDGDGVVNLTDYSLVRKRPGKRL